jgi:hypothetical protein
MRYFFHLREGDRLTKDAAGTHLPDLESAIDAAKARASALVDKAARSGRANAWGTNTRWRTAPAGSSWYCRCRISSKSPRQPEPSRSLPAITPRMA